MKITNSEKYKKIIFIIHEASRTGAPIEMLHFLKWFKQNSNIPFIIVLSRGGILVPEFKKLGYTILIKSDTYSPIFFIKIIKKIYSIINAYVIKLYLIINFKNKIGLIYSNTIVNGDLCKFLSKLECPIITHVHELNTVIKQSGNKNWKNVIKYTSHFIAASYAVEENLFKKYSIDRNIISVVYEFIPKIDSYAQTTKKEDIKKLLNLPADTFIVGGSGTVSLRKGTDIFISIANSIIKNNLL